MTYFNTFLYFKTPLMTAFLVPLQPFLTCWFAYFGCESNFLWYNDFVNWLWLLYHVDWSGYQSFFMSNNTDPQTLAVGRQKKEQCVLFFLRTSFALHYINHKIGIIATLLYDFEVDFILAYLNPPVRFITWKICFNT